MFRPKLELHVHFYDLAYSNITIVCLKREFDLFFALFFFGLPFFPSSIVFSFTVHFHISVHRLSICFSSIIIFIQE